MASPERRSDDARRAGRSCATGSPTGTGGGDSLLDPDGLLDDTLTVVVGVVDGILVGAVGTAVLLVVSGSAWVVVFGLVAWLGATAYLVRRRTVQAVVARSCSAVAVVLFLVPVIALSPVVGVEGGPGGRVAAFVVLLVIASVPAGLALLVGWVASRYVPEGADAGP